MVFTKFLRSFRISHFAKIFSQNFRISHFREHFYREISLRFRVKIRNFAKKFAHFFAKRLVRWKPYSVASNSDFQIGFFYSQTFYSKNYEL